MEDRRQVRNWQREKDRDKHIEDATIVIDSFRLWKKVTYPNSYVIRLFGIRKEVIFGFVAYSFVVVYHLGKGLFLH